jgi:L-aspartate oxidase
MGGVATDAEGRTSLPGLWACGETAATGLHGANRLASNSLLEGVAMAPWVAASIADTPVAPHGAPPVPAGAPLKAVDPDALLALRQVMQAHVGVVRDRDGLSEALEQIDALSLGADGPAEVAWLLTFAALERKESRGAHQRSDHPGTAAQARHSDVTLATARLADPAADRESAA